MESLSIKDDDLYEKQVVVPGKKTVLQTTLNIFLSGTGNLKQYKVYSNRTSDFFLFFFFFTASFNSFSYTLTATNKHVPREFMGYVFNQKLETKQKYLGIQSVYA